MLMRSPSTDRFRRARRRLAALCLAVLWAGDASAGSDQLLRKAESDLKAAAEAMQSTAVAGGYAGIVDLGEGARFGESRSQRLGPAEIWIQPPGTPSIGQCYVRAFRATGDRGYLEFARAAAAALAWSQRDSGGWDYVADLRAASETAGEPGSRRQSGRATLDDNTSQGALAFLIDLDRDLDLPWLDRAVKDGLEFLLRIQRPNGGWPQAYPPSGTYKDLDTFNDGAINNAIAVLLRAYDVYKDPRYEEAALRGGAFILARQLPGPQSGWAQQYDLEGRPAAARSFELAALSSETTAANIRTLLQLHLRTGDERYLAAIDNGLQWLETARIGPDLWPRFSELGSNRALYADRSGRRFYEPSQLPPDVRSYRWEGDFGIPRLVAARTELARLGREQYVTRNSRPRPAQVRASAVPPLTSRHGRAAWLDGDELRSATFVRNCGRIVDMLDRGDMRDP